MAIQRQRKLRYDDYARFPDDGRRWELIGGEAFMVPSPTTGYQDIILTLARRIADHLDQHGGGRVFVAPLDVLLSDHDVVQPDIVFVSDANASIITEKNIKGIPNWLVEVVSDPVRDLKVKRDLYMGQGVGEYWAVDPDLRRVEIYRPGQAPVVVEPPERAAPRTLPGLTIDLEALLGS